MLHAVLVPRAPVVQDEHVVCSIHEHVRLTRDHERGSLCLRFSLWARATRDLGPDDGETGAASLMGRGRPRQIVTPVSAQPEGGLARQVRWRPKQDRSRVTEEH